jgi:hypothetical protein
LAVSLRRHAVSIGIAVLTAALGVYLYVDSGRVTTGEADARKRNLFGAYRRAEISEMVVEQRDSTFHLTRRTDDAGESLFYVDGELADQPAVDKLLGVMEFATPERAIDPKALSRHDMGLDAPRIRVTLTMGSLKYRLDIGEPAPLPPGASFAQVNDEGAKVVSRDLVTELSRPRDVYRGRTLIPYLSSSLSQISLDGAGGSRRFVKGAWGGWAASLGSSKVRVDRDTFDRLLTSFADLRAETFTSEAEANQALAKADKKVRLTMVPLEGARAILDIGGECPGHPDDVVAVKVEPGPKKTACVPKGVMDPLTLPADSLVDHHLFSLRTDETEQIQMVAGDKRLDLARAGTGWHLRAPGEGVVDNDVGQGFVRRLYDLVGETIADPGSPSELGLTPPRGTTTLTKTGGGDGDVLTESVELGNPVSGGAVYARRSVDGAILKLAPESVEALVPSGFSLRSLKVIDEPTAEVRRIAVDGGKVRQVIHRSPSGEIKMEEPKGLSPDAGLASQLIEALCALPADRWVADADDASFGFTEPQSKYELEVGERKIGIEVGRETPGGAFARRTDRPGVFVLPRAAERAIETWVIDRSFFMVDPQEVQKVKLGDATPAADKVETIKTTLATLRTEGVVHLGAARKEEGFDKPLLRLTIQTAQANGTAPTTLKFVVGRGDVWRDTGIFYVRRDGVDATFAIAQSKIKPLLDLR